MENKTPPNTTPHVVESTPLNNGTARRAEFNNDNRAKSVRTNEDLAKDLSKREYSPIIPFLRSCISRILLARFRATRETDVVSMLEHQVISGVADKIFEEMLEDAVGFCNSNCKRRVELGVALDNYCAARNEEEGYVPLATALNTIMLHFREKIYNEGSSDGFSPGKKPYSCIPEPSRNDGKEEIIFIPMGAKAKHMKNTYQYAEAQRIPDVVAVFLSDLAERYKDTDYASEADAHHMTTNVKKGEIPKIEKDIADPFVWIDVQQTWELKKKTAADAKMEDKEWKVADLMACSPTYTTPEKPLHDAPKTQATPMIGKRSRGGVHDDGHISQPKQSRNNVDSSPRSQMDLNAPSAEEAHKDDVQCGRYAAERLSSGHCITGSSIALLDQFALSFRWYDAQRCVESFPIDILQHLPFFVVSTMIFQRFTAQNWGLFQKDQAKINVDSVDYYLMNSVPLYQLHGRRTDVSYADTRPIAPTDESNASGQADANLRRSTRNKDPQPPQLHNDVPSTENSSSREKTLPYCCKVYWPEINRIKEPKIIEKAIQRVTQHLPEEFRDMVLKHLPEIVRWEEYAGANTYEFLLHVKLAGGPINASVEDIMKQGRVMVAMISHTLQKIDDLTPAQFWKVLWDTVRCLYLLWKVGIAHGDVSITNMMCKEVDQNLLGVLNDFDLAAIMKIGCRSPEKVGFERTGTIPFMALDLLEYYEGQITRWFRHDLEASTWCLVWRTLRANPDEREKWYTGTFEASYAFKSLLFNKYDSDMADKDWEPYFEAIDAWLSVWKAVHDGMALEIKKLPKGASKFEARDRVDRADTNESSMRASVEAVVKGITEATGAVKPEMVDVLANTSWIDVQLINEPTETS